MSEANDSIQIMDPSPTTSPAHGLEKTLHGAAYQLKLITLFLLRGMNEQDEFRLDAETKDTGKFDDLIYGWRNIGDGNKSYKFFLQAKHTQDTKKKISESDLLKADGPFSLIQYYDSYIAVMTSTVKSEANISFSEETEAIRHFILTSNLDFESKVVISKSNSNSLNHSDCTLLEKFDVNEESNLKILRCNYLEKKTRFYKLTKWNVTNKLVETLVENIFSGKQIENSIKKQIESFFKHPDIQPYYEQIIDKQTKRFKDDFLIGFLSNKQVEIDPLTEQLEKIREEFKNVTFTTYCNKVVFSRRRMKEYYFISTWKDLDLKISKLTENPKTGKKIESKADAVKRIAEILFNCAFNDDEIESGHKELAYLFAHKGIHTHIKDMFILFEENQNLKLKNEFVDGEGLSKQVEKIRDIFMEVVFTKSTKQDQLGMKTIETMSIENLAKGPFKIKDKTIEGNYGEIKDYITDLQKKNIICHRYMNLRSETTYAPIELVFTNAFKDLTKDLETPGANYFRKKFKSEFAYHFWKNANLHIVDESNSIRNHKQFKEDFLNNFVLVVTPNEVQMDDVLKATLESYYKFGNDMIDIYYSYVQVQMFDWLKDPKKKRLSNREEAEKILWEKLPTQLAFVPFCQQIAENLFSCARIRKEIAGTELFMKNFRYITENNIFNETGKNLNTKFVKSKGNFNADAVRLREALMNVTFLHYCNAVQFDINANKYGQTIGKIKVGSLVKNLLNKCREESNAENGIVTINKGSIKKYINDLVDKGVLEKIETKYKFTEQFKNGTMDDDKTRNFRQKFISELFIQFWTNADLNVVRLEQ